MLHPFEVLGVGDQSLVHPLLVAGAPGLHLLDVGVDLGLLGAEVADNDAGVTGPVVERTPLLLALGDLGQLGKVRALVAQLVCLGVQLLQVEQLELGGRVGFQGVLLWDGAGRCGGPGRFRPGRSTGRCTGC
nr:hypothetical protein [Nocardioides ferulae]